MAVAEGGSSWRRRRAEGVGPVLVAGVVAAKAAAETGILHCG